MKNFALRFTQFFGKGLSLNQAVRNLSNHSKQENPALENYVTRISEDIIFPAYYQICKDLDIDVKKENFRQEVEKLGNAFKEHLDSQKEVSDSVMDNLYRRPFLVHKHSQFASFQVLTNPFEGILKFSPDKKDEVEKTYKSYKEEGLLPKGWKQETLEDFMTQNLFIKNLRSEIEATKFNVAKTPNPISQITGAESFKGESPATSQSH